MDGWTDGRMDGWMVGWMDGCVEWTGGEVRSTSSQVADWETIGSIGGLEEFPFVGEVPRELQRDFPELRSFV